MPSSELALPAGWTPARPGPWVAVEVVAGGSALLLVVGGSLQIGTGDWVVGAAVGLLGLLVGLAVAVRRRRLRDLGRAPVATVEGALRVGFSRAGLIEGLVATVVGGAAAALFAVTWWSSWLLVVLCGAGAVGAFGWLGLRYLRGIRVGELLLSPYDLRLRVDHRDVHVPWEDLTGLDAGEMRSSSGIVTGRLLTLRFRNPPRARRPQPSVGEIRVPLHRIDLDEVVLHHLLRFYREYPQARGELSGPAAVARLRDRAFPG